MAIPTWPVTLPQDPQKNFSSTGGVNVLRTPVDKGPAKQRYKSKKPELLDLAFIMTKDQVASLKTFIEDVVYGTKRFNFKHPITASTVEVRFIPQGDGDIYSLSNIAPDYYNVSIKLEVML
jgi:hypothetical protein